MSLYYMYHDPAPKIKFKKVAKNIILMIVPVQPNTFSYTKSNCDLFTERSLSFRIMSTDDPSGFTPSSLHTRLIADT